MPYLRWLSCTESDQNKELRRDRDNNGLRQARWTVRRCSLVVTSGLPGQGMPFIGRTQELAQIRQLLADPEREAAGSRFLDVCQHLQLFDASAEHERLQ